MSTQCDQKIVSSVDYVQTLLVTDTIFQNILDDTIKDSDEKDRMEDYIISLAIFLKYDYTHHATMIAFYGQNIAFFYFVSEMAKDEVFLIVIFF